MEGQDKLKAEALLAATEKTEAAQLAREKRKEEADVARDKRKEDSLQAASARKLDILKLVVLPIVLAIIAGTVTAIPGAISAWKMATEVKEIKRTGIETHTLVNSNMGVQLKATMIALERVAEITMDPKDIEAAKVAREAFVRHTVSQSNVDADRKISEKEKKS